MDLLTNSYSTGTVCKAVPVSNATLQSWLHRDHIIGQKEIKGGGGPGRQRQFSCLNVIEIAVAAHLMQLGASPKDAFRAGQRFSHTSDGGASWVGDDAISDDKPVRLSGFPYFEGGDTLLCVSGARATVVQADRTHALPMREVSRNLGNPIGFIALNVTVLFYQVMQRMGMHPVAVLDEAYADPQV